MSPPRRGRLVRPLLLGLLLAGSPIAVANGPTSVPDAPEAADAPEVAGVALTGAHLDREALVREVLERNPSLQAARAGWTAALAQVPQARAFPDPRLTATLAPLSVGSEMGTGAAVEISQPVPLAGQRGLAADVARAEANVEASDLEATRLDLALLASVLFDEYALTFHHLRIVEEHVALLEELHAAARGRYGAGEASLQDPIEARVALAHAVHERLRLESRRDVVRAQLNGLLHRAPTDPLATPVADQELPDPVEATGIDRPELDAARAALEGAEAGTTLARRQRLPDLMLMAGYSTMWANPDHRLMVGVGVEIPLPSGTRRARIEAATARQTAASRRLEAIEDQVAVEVEVARTRLTEALHVVHLYREELLPLSRDRVDAARAGFSAGRNDFAAVVAAERNLREAAYQLADAVAQANQEAARLQRAQGLVPALPDQEIR